ncbi:YsnF/AvaK domain-containing protein [Sporosarcina sp. ACRSL]|uniref:YsnF/AvaK domain-containing protein n=1 Tax=Sporosarcina sp. ACRSL TaxID=2918215 RepID=UPI001EF633F9|nr:YsnF/AvaK domain-containing protein [Sporosarcina sp. ACRSL]MCG7344189.1 YsnF/AvaK domain-containing protein [Sporosarcina sp. ACRSL]
MDDKTFIGMYHDDSELMSKIDDLKQQGIEGENIYVIAQDESDVTMFQGMKYGDVQTTPDSWFDRFLNFLTGENHVRSMLREAGVADHDMDNYYNEILNGGKLLYVDQGEINQLHTRGDGSFGFTNAGVDPNIGGNFVSEFEENELNRAQYGTSSAAFQDSNLYEGSDENFGRVGGEALRKERDYETPPNNYYGVQNRYDETNQLDKEMQEHKMRLHEERLNVDKEEVERGEISLHKDVVEEEQSFDVPVRHEEVYVERRPVNEYESDVNSYKMQHDDETIRVPITEERLEVTKKPYVSEEIVVGKRQVEDTETVNETVKREEARLEQSGEVDWHDGEDYQDEVVDVQTMRDKWHNEPH